MTEPVQFDSYEIVPVQLMYEVNFTVFTGRDYLFRLVPGYSGFELSKLDKAIDCDFDKRLIDQIGCWIAGYFA